MAGSSERSVTKVLYVRITMHVQLAVERSHRSRASATTRHSLDRYGGDHVLIGGGLYVARELRDLAEDNR